MRNGLRLAGCAAAGLALGLYPVGASAQQQVLPEIVVTAPSPIIRQAPAQVPLTSPLSSLTIPLYVFSPVTIVTEEDIRRSAAGTIGDLLSDRPGITTSGYIPNASSRPIIRGLDNFRVRVQENGIDAMDVSAIGEDHSVPINPLIADRIEVIRGPATLRWGSAAIGGVVDIQNGRIVTSPFRGTSVDTYGAVGSVDQSAQGATVLRAGDGRYALYLDAFGRTAEDYNTPLGRQANTFQRTNGQSVGSSVFFDGGYIGFNIARTASIYGIPGEGAADGVKIDLEQLKFTSRGEFRPQSSYIDVYRFWFGAADYKHDELENGVAESTYKNRETEARVEAQFNPYQSLFGLTTSALGVQAGYQDLKSQSDDPDHTLFDPTRTANVATYLFNETQLSPVWRFQTAARVEANLVDGTGQTYNALTGVGAAFSPFASSRTFIPVSFSAAVLRDLNYGMVMSANIQYSERAPRAAELFSRGQHHATETFEIGNPNLKKEAATSIELGLRRARGPLRFDTSVFHKRFNGFVFKNLTGNTCDETLDTCVVGPALELSQVIYTQRNANFTGFEAIAQLDVLPVAGGIFGVDGQYDIVDAKFSDGTYVPRIPPQRAGAGLFWRDANWFARIFMLHAFAQNRIAADYETATAGYNLLKVELSYTKEFNGPGGPRKVTLGLVGNNLLNDDVRNHVSFNKADVLAPGRDVRFFVQSRF
jgi:iron complex outermembrane receptor protein